MSLRFISLALDAIFYQVYYPLVSSWPEEVLSDILEGFQISWVATVAMSMG